MLWVLLQVFVWLIVAMALLVWGAFLAGRWFFVERFPDEIHFARTDDGWRIALIRYRPEAPNGGDPVLVCHGIASNSTALDLTDEVSLARALAGAGHDTWLLELRGRGLSGTPRLFGKHRWDWSFDEYVERDVPAAVGALLRATGRERFHWVGFSLGAVVGYGLLEDSGLAEKVRSAVAIGGPASYRLQNKYLFHWPLRNLRWLRHAFLMRLLAPLAGYWRPKLLHDPENISGAVIRRFLVNASANFSENERLQLGDWIANDQFRSIDHRRDYRKDLGKITTPILFIAGNKDRLAPPPSVKDAYDAVSSDDKKFVIASRGQSFQANYGHLDLVLGRSAPREIFPLVVGWLDAHREAPVEPVVVVSSDVPAALTR
jgi:pimeloyl-ACP methyl ester carboxylesterase